jgi:hypothetical protein
MGPVEQQVAELLRAAGEAAKRAASDSTLRGRSAGGHGATVETLHANLVALGAIVEGLTQACTVLAQEVDKASPTKPVGDGPS